VVDAVLRRAWASRDPLLVRRLDPAADPLLTSLFPEGRHLIVLPMFGEGPSRGALVVEHPARLGSRAESRVVSMLERFASHGEMALGNAALNEQMQRLAATDGLTGVANRRTFGTVLEKELERAGRTGAPVGLVLLDLDHFKQLNDRLGHQAGDRALQRVAEVLLRSARPYDTVARYGGEEFAVILPGTSPGQAASVAERFRRAVAAMDWTVPVTVSVGVASFPAHAADPVSLVKRADQALYRAKQGGRNRVVVSGGREGAPAASARPGR
jgi:diguanylate cyclase (GGDEF)-like protein